MLVTLARQARSSIRSSQPQCIDLTSLKRDQLTRLAVLTGCAVSGTKPGLVADLRAQCPLKPDPKDDRSETSTLRVLSIDMGIRNLAYALLSCEARRTTNTRPPEFLIPKLEQWNSVSVGRETLHPSDSTGDTTDGKSESVKESFEPAVMAQHAVKYAKIFTAFNPTHVLIERQRFRSGGASAVLEWSLRVGMLEAMLHAAFAVMRPDQLNAEVMSISPARVNKFWLETDGVLPLGFRLRSDMSVKSSSMRSKQTKIDLVDQIIDSRGLENALLDFGPDTEGMVRAFRDRGVGRGRKSSDKEDGVVVKKFDDISDSLLQGLAWLRWQEYRARIASNDFEGLL